MNVNEKTKGANRFNFLDCVRPPGALYEVENAFTVVAGTPLIGEQINTRQQRGDIQYLGITVSAQGHTEAQLFASTIRLDNSGDSIIEDVNLLRFSSFYRYNKQTLIPIWIQAGSTINVNITNGGAADLLVSVNQFYYDPTLNYQLVLAPPPS